MTKELLKRLGLKADATPEEIATAVSAALDRIAELEIAIEESKKSPPKNDAAKMEDRIRAKISESGGSLNREQAVLAITHQDENAAKKVKASKK